MTVELTSIDCRCNRARGYRLSAGKNLFNEPYVKIAWGRIGRKWREKTEILADALQASARLQALLDARVRRGYVVTSL